MANNGNKHKQAEELLRRTARSFYLTLQALPSSIQWPVSLAYLLARTTDMIADVVKLPPRERLATLAAMRKMINEGPSAEGMEVLNSLLSTLVPGSAEHALLSCFKQSIEWLYELNDDLKTDIIWVENIIIEGQKLDIERFPAGAGISSLSTIAELDNYIYLQAGCVGEFWTRLCLKHIDHYSNKSPEELFPLSISFGKGLQLVNILRDIPRDIAQGRCYIPTEQLQQYGLTLDKLEASDLRCLAPIVQYWREKAASYLQDGWKYMLSINHRRIRSALALPLLLGFATLGLLKDTSYISRTEPVKVSRMRVKVLMLIAALGMVSRKCYSLGRVNPEGDRPVAPTS